MLSRPAVWFLAKKQPGSAPVATTPILDLGKPLPPPADRTVTGRFATPFLTFVAFIVFTGNTYFLIVPFGYLAIAFAGVAIHELGHLLAGWAIGMRFVGFHMGPFVVHRINGAWRLRLRPVIHRGQAMMSLARIRRMRARLLVFILGGPAVSYVVGFLACAIGESHRMSDSTGWTTLLEFFGVYSVALGLLSTIPYSIHGEGNDAFLLRKLACKRQDAISMISAYALDSAISTAPIIPEYFDKWSSRAATGLGATQALVVREYELYRKASDTSVAAGHLERLMQYSPWMDDVFRNAVIAEAVVYHGYRKQNRDKAEEWFRRIINVQWIHPIARSRLSVAMKFVRGKPIDALAELNSTLAFIRQNVNGPSSRQVEEDWSRWQQELRSRMQSPAHNAAREQK